MQPPNIGAELVKNFDTSAIDPLTWRRGAEQPGGATLGRPKYEPDVDLLGPQTFVPVPGNMQVDPTISAEELRDARWLWTMQPISTGDPSGVELPRWPDVIVRKSTGERYVVRTVLDVGATQSGLRGALLLRERG